MEKGKQVEALRDCVRTHCPNVANHKPNGATVNQMADHILLLLKHRHEAIGHSDDAENLEAIVAHIQQTVGLLRSLSPTAKRMIDRNLPLLDSEKKQGFEQFGKVNDLGNGTFLLKIPPYPKPISTEKLEILENRIHFIENISASILKVRSSKPFEGRKISKKLNYKAAAVAKACKMIWREELALKNANNTKMKKNDLEPKKYVHPDYDDPMANFIEEVFKVLAIKSTVASALNSLEKLGGEEGLTFSIDIR